MHEIICPHCNKAFKIVEAGYADTVWAVPHIGVPIRWRRVSMLPGLGELHELVAINAKR